MSKKWPSDEIATLFDWLVVCTSEAAYYQCCTKHAVLYERGDQPDKRWVPVDNMAWDVMVRHVDYPEDAPDRAIRTGPPTWAEIHLLKKAARTESKEAMQKRKGPITAAYLARVLSRTEEDAASLWAKYGPAKDRGGGFGVQ